jgi:preprotein translocase subunit SecA
MFMAMIESIKEETIEFLFKVQAAQRETHVKGVFESVPQQFIKTEVAPMSRIPVAQGEEAVYGERMSQQSQGEQYRRSEPKVGRNDPCPCGKIDSKTGKPLKYKKCCYPKYG